MSLAMGRRAAGAACPPVADFLRCAADSYAAARSLSPSQRLADGEAQARLCLAEHATPGDARSDLALAARAAAEAPPERAALLGARAALAATRPGAGTAGERCAALRAGLRLAPADSREAADLARRRATLPECGDHP